MTNMLGRKNYPMKTNNMPKLSPGDLKYYLPSITVDVNPPVFKNLSEHHGPHNYQCDIEPGDIVLFLQEAGPHGLSDTLSCYHVVFATSNKPTGWVILNSNNIKYFKTPQ